MAFLQTYLIWVVYAIAVVLLFMVASVFVYIYQIPRDRSPSITLICILAISCLLATILLLPVDVALVSSTVSPSLGQRKDWATPDVVENILFSLKVVYYTLYSLDIFLCLLVIPFTYFWYEEYDEVAVQAGEQTTGQRFWGTFKYTLSFIAIVVVLLLVGFFVPISKAHRGDGLDFFKKLLTENRGERALAFSLGLLITVGMGLYILYTSTGLAILPVRLVKGGRTSASQIWTASTAVQLESNRERQRQLEGRCGGNLDLLSSKDRREFDTLVRDERTLIRRQRLANAAQEENQSFLVRSWLKISVIFRPFTIFGGVILFLLSLLTWVSMLLTAIDKAKNSICKQHCGYILAHINIFNPINRIFVQTAKVFPIDYVIFTMLVIFFFCSSVVGIASIGIRFLWIKIFQIRKGHTTPQALLLMTAMLMLIILALNYSISMIVAPQYATFGPQTFCDNILSSSGPLLDCSNAKHLVKPCSESENNSNAEEVCTPSVASTLLNRVTINFPFFGAVFFWAQFIFLGIYLIAVSVSIFRSSKLNERQFDEDIEEAEEESLLASSRRHGDAEWRDIIGRANRHTGND